MSYSGSRLSLRTRMMGNHPRGVFWHIQRKSTTTVQVGDDNRHHVASEVLHLHSARVDEAMEEVVGDVQDPIRDDLVLGSEHVNLLLVVGN